MRSAFALASLLVALACAGCRQPVARAQAAPVCGDVTLGGWAGNARCAALAQQVIRGVDRVCVTDADCALVHPGASCRNATVSASREASYRSLPTPCVDPASGPCRPVVPYCADGCCLAR